MHTSTSSTHQCLEKCDGNHDRSEQRGEVVNLFEGMVGSYHNDKEGKEGYRHYHRGSEPSAFARLANLIQPVVTIRLHVCSGALASTRVEWRAL